MIKTKTRTKAKDFAIRHGYKIRALPHTKDRPNQMIKIISPDGTTKIVRDWIDALDFMHRHVYVPR